MRLYIPNVPRIVFPAGQYLRAVRRPLPARSFGPVRVLRNYDYRVFFYSSLHRTTSTRAHQKPYTPYKTTISLNLRVARGTFRPSVRAAATAARYYGLGIRFNVYRKSKGTIILLRFVSRPNRFGKRT